MSIPPYPSQGSTPGPYLQGEYAPHPPGPAGPEPVPGTGRDVGRAAGAGCLIALGTVALPALPLVGFLTFLVWTKGPSEAATVYSLITAGLLVVLLGGFAAGMTVARGRRPVAPPMPGEQLSARQMRRAAKPPRRGVKFPAFLFGIAWVLFFLGFQVITFLRDLLPGGEGLPETGFDGLGFSLVCLILAATLGWAAGWLVLRGRRQPRSGAGPGDYSPV